jgi:hypothetical protein
VADNDGDVTPASVGLPDDPIASGSDVIRGSDEPIIEATPPTAPVSGSAEYRGSTEHGKRFAAGVYGDADRRVADFAAQDQARNVQDTARSQADYGRLEGASDNEVMANRLFAARDKELQQRSEDFFKGSAELEQRLAGEARAEREKYLTAYQEQLAGVRQLAATSGNPLGQLSKSQSVGLAGAQFAQGFLAARGIHIDVTGQIDRWVDRSIAEHQQAIQNARTSAQDQLHLYEIARQNSQDDWESRQRYRGFVIQGLQTSIQANASQFQSQIAIAKAKEQVARLQIDADATARQIGDAHFARVNQMMQTEYNRAHGQGLLSIEQSKLALERDKAAVKLLPPANRNISDPDYLTDAGGNEVHDAAGNRILVNRWRVDSTLSKEEHKEVADKADEAREKYANYLNATDSMIGAYQEAKKVRDAAPKAEKITWDELARLDESGKVAKFLQERDAWVLAKVYNDSGKQTNESEVKKQEELAYVDKLFARNGNKTEQLMSNLRRMGREKFERHMEASGLQQIQPGDPEYYARSVTASPRTKGVDDAIATGTRAVPDYASAEAGKVAAKDSEETTKNVSGAWADYQKAELSKDPTAEIRFGQPEYAVAIDHLAAAVARPDYISRTSVARGVSRESKFDPAGLRAGALKALNDIASGNDAGIPTEAIKYAQYVLGQIEGDELLSKPGSGDITDSPFVRRLADRPGARD